MPQPRTIYNFSFGRYKRLKSRCIKWNGLKSNDSEFNLIHRTLKVGKYWGSLRHNYMECTWCHVKDLSKQILNLFETHMKSMLKNSQNASEVQYQQESWFLFTFVMWNLHHSKELTPLVPFHMFLFVYIPPNDQEWIKTKFYKWF